MSIDINKLIVKSVDIIKEKCDLPDNGFLSGGSLANTVYGLLYNVETKFDDIDVFKLKDIVEDRESIVNSKFFIQTDIKKKLTRDDDDDYLPYVREIGDNFFSIDNSKEEDILNTIEYYSNVDIPFFIKGFDLNCTQVSYNLKTKEIYYTKEFEDFLINKKIEITNLKSPSNTIIRYLKKCKDLDIKPVKENIDMVYFFLKHSNNVYYDYKNFREKTYKKFKLNKDILEKYFVIKETKRKDFLVYELLLNVNAPVDKEHSDKIGKLNIIMDCYKFPKFWKRINNDEYFENIYRKLYPFMSDDYVDTNKACNVDIRILENLIKYNPKIEYNLSGLKLSEQIKLVSLLFERFYDNQIIAYTILTQNKFKNIEFSENQLKVLGFKTIIKRQKHKVTSPFKYFKDGLFEEDDKEQEIYF